MRSTPKEVFATARERTGGKPRALEILYSILAADRTASLSEVLDQTSALSPGNVGEGLIGEAFSRLDQAAEHIVYVLAIYGRPVAPSAVDFLLLPYAPTVNSAPVLERLAQMHFARAERGCYYLQAVDLPYALRRIPRGEPGDSERTPPLFTQCALFRRAADYFVKTRTPRENWHDIDGLAPQLAEFDMCCAGKEFDRAARVLLTIDSSHLLLWGYAGLAADLHERLLSKVSEPRLVLNSTINLGLAYSALGRSQDAIGCLEKCLASARQQGERRIEASALINLGLSFLAMGATARARDLFAQGLSLGEALADKALIGSALGGLGNTERLE